MATRNPFTVKVLGKGAPFCNREKEVRELCAHGRNGANVVLYSPRRFGKTSLAQKVQRKLANEGLLPVYVDFYGVTTVEEVARRLAAGVFAQLPSKSIWDRAVQLFAAVRPNFTPSVDPITGTPNLKFSFDIDRTRISGLELLDEVLGCLGRFLEQKDRDAHLILDEFQEITVLPDAAPVEGLFRGHVQRHTSAYLFVGSRRHLLRSMFTEEHRAFFRSALLYPLPPLPAEEFAAFLSRAATRAGKRCPIAVGRQIAERTEGYPYYGQKLAYLSFSIAGEGVTEDDVMVALESLLREEGLHFEAQLASLSLVQKRLLYHLAQAPEPHLFGKAVQAQLNISVGGTAKARDVLVDLDLIEETGNGWALVDPIMGLWLYRQAGQ